MNSDNKYFRLPIVVFLAVLGLFVGLVIYSYWFSERDAIKTNKMRTLKTVLNLKSNQISSWYIDELSDVDVIANDATLKSLVIKVYRNAGDEALISECAYYLKQIAREHQYFDIALLDRDGNQLVPALSDSSRFDFSDTLSLDQVLESRKVFFSDLYYSKNNRKVFADFIVPVLDRNNEPFSILVFRLVPETFLDPILLSRPYLDLTTQTLLIKNNAKGEVSTYLKGSYDLDSVCWIPSASSLLSRAVPGNSVEGSLETRDEKGEKLLILLDPIPETPWQLMLKTNESDIYKLLRVRTIYASIIGVLLIIIGIIVVYLINKTRREKAIQDLLNKEIELRHYQEQFKVTLDILGEGIVIVGGVGQILYMNHKAEQFSGWTFKETRKNKFEDILLFEDEKGKRISFKPVIEKMAQIKDNLNYTVSLTTRDGHSIPFDMTIHRIESYEENNALIFSLHDQSEMLQQQKAIQKSESRFRNLFQNAPDGFLLAGLDGSIQMSNLQATELFGYDATEMLQLKVWDLVPERFHFELSYWKNMLEPGKPVAMGFNMVLYGRRKDGSEFPFQVALNPISETGEDPQIMCIVRDNTEKRLNEQYIRTSGAVLSNMQEGVCWFSENEGLILQTNETFDSLFGYTPEELINKHISSLLAPDEETSEEKGQRLMEELRRELKIDIEIPCLSKEGKVFWASFHVYSFVHDEFGPIWMSICQDIHQRKKAEEELALSEAAYKNLFEDNPLPLWVYDIETWKFMAVNKAAIAKYGYTLEEFLTMEVFELIPEEDREEFYRIAIPGSEFQLETTCRHRLKDGTFIYVERASHNLNYYNRQARLVLVNDVTKTREYEFQLIAAKEKAEESDRLKSAFLANMSHEIRTPLNGIIGFSSIIAEGEVSPENMKRYATHIESGGNRLLDLLDNIMRLSRIESGVEEIRESRFDVQTLLGELSNPFMVQAEKNGLEMRISMPGYDSNRELVTDQVKFSQILSNYLSNAFKFTEKGFVELGYSILDDKLDFYVKDSGRGIPAEHQKAIFDRFYQVDNTISRGFEGAGLGLSICKGFADMLEAEIRIDSEVGKGSTFHLLMPLKNS